MATKTKVAKKAAKSAPAKNNLCTCGCGAKVRFNFAQGHDARLKGMLLRGEIKNPTSEQRAFAKEHGVKIGSQKKAKAA